MVKPRRSGFLLYFQHQMVFPVPFPSTIFLLGGSPEYYFPLRASWAELLRGCRELDVVRPHLPGLLGRELVASC